MTSIREGARTGEDRGPREPAGSPRRPPRATPREWIFLAALSALVVLALLQTARTNLYHPRLAEARMRLHRHMTARSVPPRYPPESWERMRIRVLVPVLVERLKALPGLSVHRATMLVDGSALWASLLVLWAWLRRHHGPPRALTGWLLFAALLPLTSLAHFYHPEDRLALLAWGLALLLLHDGRVGTAALLAAAATVNKYDLLLLAPLPLLWLRPGGTADGSPAGPTTKERLRRGLVRSLAFALPGLLVFLALRHALGGSTPLNPTLLPLVKRNLLRFLAPLDHPGLVPLLLCLGLTAAGWRDSPRELRESSLLGLGLLGLYAAFTVFHEFRAWAGVVVLMLPVMTTGLVRLAGGRLHAAATTDETPENDGRSAPTTTGRETRDEVAR